MRASILFGAIFATAAIAAPLLEQAFAVEGVVEEVESVTKLGAVPRSPLELPEVGAPLDVTKTLPDLTEKLPLGELPTSGLGTRGLSLKLSSSTVTDLVSEVSDLLDTVKSDLSDLLDDAENLDVGGILGDVRDLLAQVLSDVHTIVEDSGLSLPLSRRDSPLDPVLSKLDDVSELISSLTGLDIAEDLVGEIHGVLDDVLRLVGNLL